MAGASVVRQQRIGFGERGQESKSDEAFMQFSVAFMRDGLLRQLKGAPLSAFTAAGLHEADLQPHRYRCWKTPTLNAAFLKRASRVLWCHERVDRLRARDEVVIALDEKPNIQALERAAPKQLMRPNQIERQELI